MSSVTQAYGANIAFIEELYERYRANPESVSASWREFFHDYQPQFEEDLAEDLEEQRAVAAQPRAGVATATSVRNIPVKALEENRRVINNHLALTGQSKASFTHIIAWALVKAVKDQPRMNSAFSQQDGNPVRIDREDVNLGIAIDVERKGGTRSLLVPNVKRAQATDFAGFLKAYNDVVRKARNNTLEVSDFEGTTISLTNPGTIGTIASVPRLMQTQGTIIA